MSVVVDVSEWMALLPLLALGALRHRGINRDAAFWWIALGLAVSFVADVLSRVVNPDLVGNIFPVLQSGIIACVLLPRADALASAGVLTVVGVLGTLLTGALGIDVLLATVANGVVVLAALGNRAAPFTRALLVYFGLGGLAWLLFAVAPTWSMWVVYQAARALGLAFFCGAVWMPSSRLAVVRS